MAQKNLVIAEETWSLVKKVAIEESAERGEIVSMAAVVRAAIRDYIVKHESRKLAVRDGMIEARRGKNNA